MGSLTATSPRLAAFQSDIYPRGLDLRRSVIIQDVGVFRADTAADFEAGMLVMQDTNGNLVKCTGKSALGVAKWNKTNNYTATVVDEQISFATANSTVNLKHASVFNVQVRSAAAFGGSAYTVTTDYTVSTTNGTVTQVSTGAIPLATTVYVSYSWTLGQADLDLQGRNFFNYTDDVTIADGRITVITDAAMLFTTQYDISRVYTLTGTGKNLYCGGATAALAGLFTNNSSEGEFVGHVVQLPTADDPFLGVRIGGNPVVYA